MDFATRSSEQADKVIQKARQAHHQKLRKYGLAKSVLPDDLKKAAQRMEDVVKKGHEDVKRVTDWAKRVLEG